MCASMFHDGAISLRNFGFVNRVHIQPEVVVRSKCRRFFGQTLASCGSQPTGPISTFNSSNIIYASGALQNLHLQISHQSTALLTRRPTWLLDKANGTTPTQGFGIHSRMEPSAM